jgi:hypothetical protein
MDSGTENWPPQWSDKRTRGWPVGSWCRQEHDEHHIVTGGQLVRWCDGQREQWQQRPSHNAYKPFDGLKATGSGVGFLSKGYGYLGVGDDEVYSGQSCLWFTSERCLCE